MRCNRCYCSRASAIAVLVVVVVFFLLSFSSPSLRSLGTLEVLLLAKSIKVPQLRGRHLHITVAIITARVQFLV